MVIVGAILGVPQAHALQCDRGNESSRDKELAEIIDGLSGEYRHNNDDPTEPIVSIELRGRHISDEVMKMLRNATALEALDISATAVSDKGIEAIKDLRHLRVLHLPDGVADKGMEVIGGLTDLRVLSVGQKVTDTGMLPISRLHRLEELYLHSGNISDAGMNSLARLKRLRVLNIWETRVTDRGLLALIGISTLDTIILSTRITDDGLRALASFKELRFVVVNSAITDQGMRNLAKCSVLELLELEGSLVSDSGLSLLSEMKYLRSVGVKRTRVTAEGALFLERSIPGIVVVR
jgi:hypothetical protein